MAGVVPGLATVLVGEDPASRLCVDSKHRDCAEVGIRSVRVQLHGDATQAEILNVIDELNACQDNDISWFDWANVDHDLLDFTQRLIRLRREHPVLRRRRFLTGAEAHEVGWFTPSGTAMTDSDWDDTQARAIAVYLDGQDDPDRADDGTPLLGHDLLPALTEVLTGRFTEHHALLARVHLDLIDYHTHAVQEITARIEVMMEPFRGFHTLIATIPGIGTLTADVIVAETGADMTRFPTAKHLASRAGTTPGSNESAGKVKSSKTRPGNPYLQGALGDAATSCSQNPSGRLSR